MGCCEKQAVETAVFCWASGPITWPQPGPVGTFLWTSSAVPVTFPLGSSPLLPPSLALSRKPTVAPPLRSPNLVERSKGAGGPERTRGRVAWSGGADQGVRSRLTAYVRRSAASSEPDGTRGIRLSN